MMAGKPYIASPVQKPQATGDVASLTVAYGVALSEAGAAAVAEMMAFMAWQMGTGTQQAWIDSANALAMAQAAVDSAYAALLAAIQAQGG
jgi:hypothetical protein